MEKILINTIEDFKSEIIIQEGLKENIKDFLEDKKYFVITNTTLKKLYPKFLSNFNPNRIITIKDGEEYKNYKTVNEIIKKLLKEKIERKDCIIAFGGGVTGDIAGYVASVILRGVELIQIPTTLLAMCDSSIGGKTGYNTKFGKNLVGTFHFAKKVLIDPGFLNTLEHKQYVWSLGEIIKYALIEKTAKPNSDFNLLNILKITSMSNVKKNIFYIINSCATLKAQVVAKDRKENDFRKILNLGHTYAHAIETITNYKKISHGQAVAMGIKYASRLAYNLKKIDVDYFQEINALLEGFSLINYKLKFDKTRLIELMKQDKKVTNNKISLLVPVGRGEVELFDNIDLPSIEASLL